ncbi:class I SAM-dependent methyltransferase [Zavarzinella formosa]|uniref:class I SAM-dependent methyltransferase n=1 Tax=Zavarzinella formosa TaxID=360055 RepID=UPI0002EE8AA5|nr:class I SAM-dependent methyltransferase [Zavarzinella formosa]
MIRWLLRLPLKASCLGFKKGPHVTRYAMYRRMADFRCPNPAGLKVLSISHSEPLCHILGFEDSQLTDASYPAVNILSLPYPDATFDYVISDQVMEHIEGNPNAAFDECFRVLKPGGMVIHTTCFINPIHGFPSDYWRFTPNALSFLCRDKATILESAGWGNPYVWLYSAIGMRSQPIPHARWHPLNWLARKNSQYWPISTWVVAKKHEVA